MSNDKCDHPPNKRDIAADLVRCMVCGQKWSTEDAVEKGIRHWDDDESEEF